MRQGQELAHTKPWGLIKFNFNLYTMKTTDRLIKAFEKFNEDLKEFGEQTGEVFVTLYEDANTTREVTNFKLYKNGKLTWVEMEDTWKDGQRVHESRHEEYLHTDDDDIQDTLNFWRANLRRAKRYWAMDAETLDKIQDGQVEDTTDTEE